MTKKIKYTQVKCNFN